MAWFRRLTGLWKRDHRDRELDEELRYHFDRRITDSINAGMSAREAYEAAQRSFGNFTLQKERTRDVDILGWLESFIQDVRYGVRSLIKNPGFATVAILTLALGIGANTALFSVVNGVLLKPLPYPQPDQLVAIHESKVNFPQGSISYPNFRDWQHGNHTFAAMAIARGSGFTLTGRGEPEQVRAGLVTSDFFRLLGVQPLLGRNFDAGEDEIGAAPVAMVSEGFWVRKLDASPAIIGQTLT